VTTEHQHLKPCPAASLLHPHPLLVWLDVLTVLLSAAIQPAVYKHATTAHYLFRTACMAPRLYQHCKAKTKPRGYNLPQSKFPPRDKETTNQIRIVSGKIRKASRALCKFLEGFSSRNMRSGAWNLNVFHSSR